MLSLHGNRYETTIFTIISAIMKLSRVSDIPQCNRLWRGLEGVVLPDQFWRNFPECTVSFCVRVAKMENAKALLLAFRKKIRLKKLDIKSEKAVETLFNEIDVDRNGIISIDELKAAIDKYQIRDRKALVAELENLLESGDIDRERFSLAVKKLRFETREAGELEARVFNLGLYEVQVAAEPTEINVGGQDGVRMAVCLPMSKFDFESGEFEGFIRAIKEICSVEDSAVLIEKVEDKPNDFLGGGIK